MEYNPSADEDTLADALSALLRPALDALAAAPSSGLPTVAGASILDDIWNAVSSLLQFPSGFYNWMQSNVGGALNWITSTTGNIKDFIVARVEWVANNLVIPAVNAVSNVVSGLPGAISSAASWVWDRVSPAINAVSNFVQSSAGWLYDQLKAVIAGIGSFIQSTADWLWGVIRPVFDWVATQVSAGINWLWTHILPIFDWVATQVSAGINWLWLHILPIFDWVTARVGDSATWVAGQTFNYVIQGAAALGDGFRSALEWLMHGAFDDTIGTMTSVLSVPGKMLSGSYHSGAEMLADLHLDGSGGGFTRFLYSLCAFIPTLASITVGLGPIYAADALQNANKIVGPALLSMSDLRDAWLRGIINDAQLTENLGRMGFVAARQEHLKQLFFEPAPPSDLVRFLVREVFDPQQRQSLQLDGDYPAAADAEARKVGLAPETMRNYWAAHWQLPSPSQVYEMLHRGRIDLPQVDAYLKAADYSPAWRSHLASISYNVPGRIDLRRMYAAGAIDEPRLLKGYKDLGYNDSDAAIFVSFAKKLAAGTTKDLPRGVILDGYREGDMDRGEAIANLTDLKFLPEDASFMLDLEDLKNAKELRQLGERAIAEDYKVGAMNEAQALAQLGLLGTPAARAKALVNLWGAEQLLKTQKLSVGELQHAVREKLLPEPVALQRFKAIGFTDGDAQMLITLAHPKAPQHTPPTLSLSHLFTGLRRGVFNQAQLQERLTRMGYSPPDAAFLVELATPDLLPAEPAELTKAELIAAAKKAKLPVAAVQRRLAAKGYSAQDVDTLMELQGFAFTPTGQLVAYPRRDLTVAQLSKAFRTGELDEKELRFRLGELSYADADIDILVDLATPAAPNG